MTEAASNPHLVHGTAVMLEGWAVLLRGPSGAGKSDLALRLIGQGGVLVSDDQVGLGLANGLVYAQVPERIQGLLEVRGVGLVAVPFQARAPLALILDLVDPASVPRLPDAETEEILGVQLPRLRLHAFEASAPDKVKVALRSLLG